MFKFSTNHNRKHRNRHLFESADAYFGCVTIVTYKKVERPDEDGDIEEVYYIYYYESSKGSFHDKNGEEMDEFDLEENFGQELAEMMENEDGDENSDGTLTIDMTELAENNVDLAERMAKEFFGTTTNFTYAGYILRDGEMLDFSYGQGMRVADHREIGNIGPSMLQFMNMGEIRISYFKDGQCNIDLIKKPTRAQYSTLTMLLKRANDIYLDIDNKNGKTILSKQFYEAYEVLNAIEDNFH